LSSMIQERKIKLEEEGVEEEEEEEEEEEGWKREEIKEEESSQFLLRSVRRTLKVEVLQHVLEHLVVFFIDAIAP